MAKDYSENEFDKSEFSTDGDTPPENVNRTPEEVFRETYPEGAALIEYMNRAGFDFTFDEFGMEDAAEAFNMMSQRSVSVILINNINAALDADYLFKDGRMLSYRQALQEQFPNSEIKVDGEEIIIINPDGKVYSIDKETAKPVHISDVLPSTTPVSRFERPYKDGKTVFSSLMTLLNTARFKELAKELGVKDEIIEEFAANIVNVNKYGKNLKEFEYPLIPMIRDILDNDDFVMLLVALSCVDEELFSIIFETE